MDSTTLDKRMKMLAYTEKKDALVLKMRINKRSMDELELRIEELQAVLVSAGIEIPRAKDSSSLRRWRDTEL